MGSKRHELRMVNVCDQCARDAKAKGFLEGYTRARTWYAWCEGCGKGQMEVGQYVSGELAQKAVGYLQSIAKKTDG